MRNALYSPQHRTTRAPMHTKSMQMHVRVAMETVVALITILSIGSAVYVFVLGSNIFSANRERAGVHLTRTVHDGDTYISGSFTARSDCTQVTVLPHMDEGVPVIFLEEHERAGCALYAHPRPYTFMAAFDSAFTSPVAVYINGDRIDVDVH